MSAQVVLKPEARWPITLALFFVRQADHLVTRSVTDAVCESAPFVPLMVSPYVPRGVLSVGVTVSVVLPVAGFRTKTAVVPPPGTPLTLKLTAPLNPPVGVTVIV